jgi:hypothetical protein
MPADTADGFIAYSHAGDDLDLCRTYVRERLGMPRMNGEPHHTGRKLREVAAYDYHSASGELLYQVVRFEPKTFRQRRPDGRGGWIWDLRGVERVIYRLPEVLEAVASEHPVFVVEGEKDANRLWSLNIPATTCPQGAGKWQDSMSSDFPGATLYVIPDNDKPGREHADKVAASLTQAGATVCIVNLPGLAEHADVSNWLDAGGAADVLYQLAERAPLWSPDNAGQPPRFELVPFDQISWTAEGEYLVKGMIPLVGLTLCYGPPKCGKSFWAYDVAMHVARGMEYRGRCVRQGAVVYVAAEGGRGFTKRAEGYRRRYGGDGAPFYLVTARPDLSADHGQLIADIRAQLAGVLPVAIFVDTVNRTLVGSESKDADVGRYLRACGAIEDAFSCAVVLIHHCGLEGGRPRGHTSFSGAVDAQIAIERDAANNVIATVELSKDGPVDHQIVSALESVEVGIDDDGDAVTSCVIVPVDGAPIKPQKPQRLNEREKFVRRTLADIVLDRGIPAPADAPAWAKAIGRDELRVECFRRGFAGEETKPDTRLKAFGRALEKLQGLNIIAERDKLIWLAQPEPTQ